MFLISSISRKEKALDYSRMIVCPSCSAYGRVKLYISYQCLSLFFLPVFSWDKAYYASLSCCQAVFSLDKSLGRQLEKGQDIDLGPKDLVENLSRENICKTCGQSLKEGYSFCPYCGGRIK